MSAGCSRRSFTESLALAALVPALGIGGGALVAPRVPVLIADAPGSAEPGALAQALARAIRAQYGARLSRRDLATITQQIQSGLDRAEEIRKVELGNGDEPDFVFSAPSGSTAPR
jgi:hypothetical protein